MDLKKLYGDVTVLIGRELPIYEFLSFCDTGVRTFLCRYPKKLIVGKGEYTSPDTLNASFALDGMFYTALLYFIVGSANKDAKMLEKSSAEAESAFISLWRNAARGKRMACDRW